MTFTGMIKKLARFMQADAVAEEGRVIKHVSDFTEADKESIDVYVMNLTNLFYHSNGRKWEDVLMDIHRIAPIYFRIGFKEQDEVIATCREYGITFM